MMVPIQLANLAFGNQSTLLDLFYTLYAPIDVQSPGWGNHPLRLRDHDR